MATRLLTTTASAGVEVAPIRYVDAMTRLFGRVPGLLDSSQLGEEAATTYRDYSDIDSKYDHRKLTIIDPAMTLAQLQEMLAIPMLFLATQVVVTHEKNWKFVSREFILQMMARIGPTGIPRASTFRTELEEGQISRFGDYVTIPNELLADPNFGLDNLIDAFESKRANFVFTLTLEMGMHLATRPHINRIRAAERADREYTFIEHDAFMTRDFMLAAKNPEFFTRRVAAMFNTLPRKNVAIVADENLDALQYLLADEKRAFPARIMDTTGTTKAFAAELEALMIERVPVFRPAVSVEGDALLVCMPTMRAHSLQHWSEGFQPFRRQVQMAGAVPVPTRDYATDDNLHPLQTATSMLHLTNSDARFMRMRVSDGIRRQKFMGVFASDDAGSGPSEAMERVLGKWNERADMQTYYNTYLVKLKDLNRPTDEARAQSANKNKVKDVMGFRDSTWLLHGVHTFSTANPGVWAFYRMEFVRQLGQFMEHVLPVRHFLNIIRTAKRGAAGDPGKRNSVFATILGSSSGYVTGNLENARFGATQFERADVADDVTFTDRVMGYVQRQRDATLVDADAGAVNVVDARRTAHLPPTYRAAILQLVPDSHSDAMAGLLPHLERAAEQQPAEVDALLEVLNGKLSLYKEDLALSQAISAKVVKFLNDMGFNATAALDAPLPRIEGDHMKKARQLMLTQAVLDKKSGPGTEADWSKARNFATRLPTAPLAARPPPVGGPGRVFTVTTGHEGGPALDPDVDDLSDIPIDLTHFAALKQILPGLPADETWMLMEMFRLPFDVPTVARLDEMGIQLFNATFERYNASFLANSMEFLRGQGETVDTMLSPVRTECLSHGMSSETDFRIAVGAGPRWKQPKLITELACAFGQAVRYGVRTGMMESLAELMTHLDGSVHDDGAAFVNDVFLNLYPITETEREYPSNIFGGEVLTEEQKYVEGENILRHLNSGHALLRDLLGGRDVFADIENRLTNEAADAVFDGRMPVSPIVHREACYWYNTATRNWSIVQHGTGPRGSMMMNNHEAAASVYNGGQHMFPASYPDHAAI